MYSSAGLTPDDVKRLVEQETYKSLNGDAFALRLETALSTSHPFEKLKRDVGELESTKADKSRMSTLEETLETSIKRAVRNVTDDLERVETSSKRLGEDISGVRRLAQSIELTDSSVIASRRPIRWPAKRRHSLATRPRVTPTAR